MFKKILIANRGEIAVRIMRTCKEMGICTVAVYPDADADSLHVKLADEAYYIGPGDPIQSYLDMEKIIEIANRSQAEAVHPGYGFLAENPEFVEMCEKQGLTFIGPPSECMYQVKPKHRARDLMRMLNIPVVPGYDKILADSTSGKLAQIEELAGSSGYPLILKPSGGGGGIGMTVVRNKEELQKAVISVEESGRRLFGITSFYIEKLLPSIKHIEFQILADKYGNVIHLGERDCSIQRRFQKLIEEAPCSILPSHLRIRMAAAALAVAVTTHYVNALTVEFFYVPQTQEFYFNEVNTRLQVEHCVTETATGVDIVEEQIRIAAGERLTHTQEDIHFRGPVLECRITAEDAAHNFIPCPGTVTNLRLPHGQGIRIDEGIYEGYEISFYYDSLLLKLMTWGETRSQAILRMRRALDEMSIGGLKTTIPFHRIVLEDDVFMAGQHTTEFVKEQNICRRVRELESKGLT
jgi:acetyl-CoA carboxylase biotin carboxylase subunit